MNYYLQNPESKHSKKEKGMNTKLVIYLGELPPNVDQYSLNQFIMSNGKFNIESIYISNAKESSYAYIKFKNREEALKAVRILHLKNFNNYIIKAEPFKQANQTDRTKNEANLFVKNLPPSTTSKDLYDLFCKFGNIISVNLKRDIKGECIGYGYVNFELEKSATDAITQMNQFDYNGNKLTVSLFEPKEKRLEEGSEFFPPMVIVKNIKSEINETELLQMFEPYGQICISGIIGQNDEKMGVVLFSKKEEAEDAKNNIQKMNSQFDISLTPVDNEIIEKVKKAKQEGLKKKYDKCNLLIKNLPKEIEDKELLDIFKPFGEIIRARVQVEGKLQDKLNDKGEVIDKIFSYVSKGCGFVLFKRIEDAKNARDALNEKDTEYNGIKLKLIIDYFDYSKRERTDIAEMQQQMAPKNKQQWSNKRQFDNSNNNNNNPRGGMKQYNKQSRQIGNKYNNNMQNIHHQYQQPQYSNKMNVQQGGNFGLGNHPFYNGPPNKKEQEENKITVESEDLVNKVKKILEIENYDDRTENLGETLFYFLLKFIKHYKLNITEGKYSDTSLCSKLTGILIKTDVNNLLDIISTNDSLYSSLKEVLLKLMQTNGLDSDIK